ncbi:MULTISPECIES: D-aminoacyl-tRNA deacylase [Halomonadaceae]|uniref:D-aminoacyl-tRNA deacylase n=1 Tax=Halomonadaceae TaxID=28256 RepID=UPI001598D7EF|nr:MULTISPECIES: D-aminoacyl-tRNA deacylase [Halomonas]QJQ95465.1 D-tyrosyl-tRNA(Tyr) deacylase [Halomonas sp. PA5]
MKALIQRVRRASVDVHGRRIASIDHGLLALIGVERNDDRQQADRLLYKLLNYRVFSDIEGKMNLNLQQARGDLLLVSQFTLVADTGKGLRPSFSSAAPPEAGKRLFNYLVESAESAWPRVDSGEYGADMRVELINDGPVTFLLES